MSDYDQYSRLPVPARGPFRQFPAPLPPDPGVILYPGDSGSRRPPGADDFYLRETWRIVRKRKWLILAIVFLATAYATIDTYRTKPLYRASATIEIGRDNAAHLVRTSEVFLLDDDSLSTSMKTSEVILRSDPLLEDVVQQLQLDKLPRFSDVATPQKPFGEAVQELSLKIRRRLWWFAPNVPPTPPPPPITLVRNPVPGTRSRDESDRLEPFVTVLQRSIGVTPIRETRAMTISYTHTDPSLAAGIANAIADRFVETSFEKKVEKFASASGWLERSTKELKEKIESSEQALADFTKNNNIYAIEVETLNTQRLSRLHDQANRTETDRILKESLYAQVREGKIAQVPEAFADPQTVELQKKLNELLITASGLNVTYGPRYPKLAEINEQIETIRGQIAASRATLEDKLKADYERSVRDDEALKQALAIAKNEASQENQLSIQYSILKQDVETARALYKEFLQKTNQAGLEVAQQNSSIRVITPARIPKLRVSPNLQRAILTWFFLSLSAGIGLALLLERFDDTIRNVDHVNTATQLPALAVIPAIGSGGAPTSTYGRWRKELPPEGLSLFSPSEKHSPEIQRARIVELDSRSPIAEAYRALRTSVLLSSQGKPPKTILVTSVRSSEGKTTTATNTAISLAQLGAAVVLIDCDMRKPSAHEMFGVQRHIGLSSYLNGDVGLDESVIQSLPTTPNLSLIASGPIPENPSELLSSERMRLLLRELSQRFDHIVIDSPPIGSVTDPVILSTIVDGVILVVHAGQSSRHSTQRACRELTAVGARIFGIVLNNVNLRRDGYGYHYYYSYYSGYYSANEKKRKS